VCGVGKPCVYLSQILFAAAPKAKIVLLARPIRGVSVRETPGAKGESAGRCGSVSNPKVMRRRGTACSSRSAVEIRSERRQPSWAAVRGGVLVVVFAPKFKCACGATTRAQPVR